MSSGYIYLWKKLKNWQWFNNSNCLTVFVHLLIDARWTDGFSYGVEVKRGQHICGQKEYAMECGISYKAFRVVLDKLRMSGEITVKGASRYSIITLCNYDKYQQPPNDKGRARGEQGASKGRVTNKEKKEQEKEKDYTPNFESFWKKYPKKVGKKKAFAAWQKADCENGILQDVLKGAEQYAKYVSSENTEQKFIAHPTTWLNNERWTDEYSSSSSEPEYFDPFKETPIQ